MTEYELTHPRAPRDISDKITATRVASLVCLIAGLWLFVSPWAYYGESNDANAWNSWAVGTLMFLCASARIVCPVYSMGVSWANMLLGIWVFFSPWIYGYAASTGRLINSLCVGVIVAAFSIVSAKVAKQITAPKAP